MGARGGGKKDCRLNIRISCRRSFGVFSLAVGRFVAREGAGLPSNGWLAFWNNNYGNGRHCCPKYN